MKLLYSLLLAALTSIGWAATDDAPRTFYRSMSTVTNTTCTFHVTAITWTTSSLAVTTSNSLTWAISPGDTAYFWSGVTNLFSTGGPYRVITVSSAANGVVTLSSQQSSSRASALLDPTGRLRVVKKYSRATVTGKKLSSGALVNNTGTIYIGTGTNMAHYAIAPGDEMSLTPPRVHDLNDWYFVPTTAGDGVYIIYWP